MFFRRDVRAFKTCMQDILSSKCEDDPRMFHQWDVYYFRDLIGRGMNWTCFGELRKHRTRKNALETEAVLKIFDRTCTAHMLSSDPLLT